MSSSKHMADKAGRLGQTLVACALTVALVATFVTVDGTSATATDEDVYASLVQTTASTGDNTIDVTTTDGTTTDGYVYASFTPDETEVYSITVTGDTDLADDTSEGTYDETTGETGSDSDSDSDDESSSSSRNNYVQLVLREAGGDRLARGRGNSDYKNCKVQYLLESGTTYYLALCFADYSWGSIDPETTGTISYTIESGTATKAKKTNKRYTVYNLDGERWMASGDYAWFSFTTPDELESEKYRFYTKSASNSTVSVYDTTGENGVTVTTDTNSGAGKNGSVIVSVNAETTYYIKVKNSRKSSDYFYFWVSPVLSMEGATVSFAAYDADDNNNITYYQPTSSSVYKCYPTVSITDENGDTTTFQRTRDYLCTITKDSESDATSVLGKYKVTVTDFDDHTINTSYTIVAPETETISAGGSSTVTVTGTSEDEYTYAYKAFKFTPSVGGYYTVSMTSATNAWAGYKEYWYWDTLDSTWTYASRAGSEGYAYIYSDDSDDNEIYTSDSGHFAAGETYYIFCCARILAKDTTATYTFSISSAPTKTADVGLSVTSDGTVSVVAGSSGSTNDLSAYVKTLSEYYSSVTSSSTTNVALSFGYDDEDNLTGEIYLYKTEYSDEEGSTPDDGTYTVTLVSSEYVDIIATLTVKDGKVTAVSVTSGTQDAATAAANANGSATKAASIALKAKKISVKGSWDKKKKKNKKAISVAASKYVKLSGIKSATYKLAGGAKGVKVASNGKITLAKGKFKKGKTVTVKVKVTPKKAASGYSLPTAKTLAVKIVLK